MPPIRVAFNADSLATWFMPAFAASSSAGTALLDVVLDDQDHTADWLRQGQVLAAMTASYLATAPAMVFNAKDRLQDTWLAQHLGRSMLPPMHRLPSSHAFVEAALPGIGWGMCPIDLIAQHLQSGALVELVPGQHVNIALYWQHTPLAMQQIKWLTEQVLVTAKDLLAQRQMEVV